MKTRGLGNQTNVSVGEFYFPLFVCMSLCCFFCLFVCLDLLFSTHRISLLQFWLTPLLLSSSKLIALIWCLALGLTLIVAPFFLNKTGCGILTLRFYPPKKQIQLLLGRLAASANLPAESRGLVCFYKKRRKNHISKLHISNPYHSYGSAGLSRQNHQTLSRSEFCASADQKQKKQTKSGLYMHRFHLIYFIWCAKLDSYR